MSAVAHMKGIERAIAKRRIEVPAPTGIKAQIQEYKAKIADLKVKLEAMTVRLSKLTSMIASLKAQISVQKALMANPLQGDIVKLNTLPEVQKTRLNSVPKPQNTTDVILARLIEERYGKHS